MLDICEQYYQQMKVDLRQCIQKELDAEKEVECCHSIVESYWFKVKALMQHYEFRNSKEEIFYNRELKPRFVAEKEYYSLLYHAALFLPQGYHTEERDFWLRESKRLEKFIHDNQEFYAYMKSGKTHYDKLFFTGEEEEGESIFAMSHSRLVAMICALERYDEYVRGRIMGSRNVI